MKRELIIGIIVAIILIIILGVYYLPEKEPNSLRHPCQSSSDCTIKAGQCGPNCLHNNEEPFIDPEIQCEYLPWFEDDKCECLDSKCTKVISKSKKDLSEFIKCSEGERPQNWPINSTPINFINSELINSENKALKFANEDTKVKEFIFIPKENSKSCVFGSHASYIKSSGNWTAIYCITSIDGDNAADWCYGLVFTPKGEIKDRITNFV